MSPFSETQPETVEQQDNRRPDITKLNQWALDAEAADRNVFADMRSSILLINGDHYSRLNDQVYDRIRTSRELSTEIKVRLTKNHIGKIHKLYANNIMTYAPGVWVSAKNESELADIKAAELANSIWQDAKDKLNYEDQVSSWADDFCAVAEVWTKIYFDPNAGALKGYEQAVDPLTEQPMFEMVQQQLPDGTVIEVPDQSKPIPDKDKPIFYGEIKFEEVYGFNVFRSAESKSLEESPWYMIRKMVSVDKLKKAFPDPKKQQMIASSSDRTFLIFDNNQGGYRKSDPSECLIREWFMKPCLEYPEGYYWITSETGVLDEGELPGGIFPLVYGLFDKAQTSPRGRGIVKQIRPYQIEINRCASKIAEHQMTLGDDKLIMFQGSKMSSGGQVPGVRGVTVQGGQAPTVLPGRNGSQYLEYMQSQITEMYKVAMVDEDSRGDVNGQLDPYALLFKSASQKKVFKRHIKRFESFLMKTCKLYLQTAKMYLPDDAVILAIGKKEKVNIREFKNSNDLTTEVKVESRTDDVETLMGKQLVMNHLIQYAGNQMSKEDIGKLIKQMPYANVDDSFSDLTLDYEMGTNIILALDRGEMPDINPEEIETQVYLIKRLEHRMMQSDFKGMPDFIKTNYLNQMNTRRQLLDQMKLQAQRDQAGWIPSTGALIDAGAWIPDPNGEPGKTIRLRLPQDSIYWLYKTLQSQGYMMAELNQLTPQQPPQGPAPQGPRGPQSPLRIAGNPQVP